jgi:hypothetical protein
MSSEVIPKAIVFELVCYTSTIFTTEARELNLIGFYLLFIAGEGGLEGWIHLLLGQRLLSC